jgi:hypothetical protein
MEASREGGPWERRRCGEESQGEVGRRRGKAGAIADDDADEA